MSAALDATSIWNACRSTPWPSIPLLHLHLRHEDAALLHVGKVQHRATNCARAVERFQTPATSAVQLAALPKAPQGRVTGDPKHALSAFTAAFGDAFKRKQANKCLKLTLDYAFSLPRHPGVVDRQQSPQPTNEGSNSHVTRKAAPALSLRGKRHLSQVLKGRHQELMKMLIAEGNVAGAIQYLRLLPPDRQLCSCLMKECSAASDITGLQLVIQARRSLGMQDDAFSFCALVTTASRTGDAQLLSEVLESAQAANACNVAVCNAAIEAFGRLGNAGAAVELFEKRMPILGVQTDIITYNSLLRALGRSNDPSQSAYVLCLYDRLCTGSGLTPDKHTFSALFSAAKYLGICDGSFLLQVLSDTSIYGVPLNSRIVFTFLQACWGATFTREQVARVFAEVAALRAHRQPDQSVFAALLTFAQRHLPEHATDVWAALQEDSLLPNEHIYSALFAACAAGRTPDLLATAAAAEACMHQQWLSLKSTRLPQSYSEEGWRIAYNSLLNLHAKTGTAELAESVYQEMLVQGPLPDKNSANSTIAAFAAVGDTDAAFKRFREMTLRGLRPDSRTFGALLHACAQEGKYVSAARVLELMRGAGLAPTVQAYTSYMDACVKANTATSLARAFQVFEQMQAENIPASEVTYGCLLVACERLGDVDRAFLLYKQACQQGIAPSDECHNILVNVCTATGRLHEALELVKDMARSHRYMQAATLNSLVRALAPSSAARALRMVSFMTTLGLPTYHLTSIALIGACARQHLSAEASDLYWRLRKKAVLVTRSAGSDLIVALCKAEQPHTALRVYHDMMASAFGSPGHLLPQTSAAEKDTQQDFWSSTSDQQPASAAGRAHATSESTAHDSSDLADGPSSDALHMLEVVSAGTPTESMKDAHAVSTESDPLTTPEANAVSSPAVLQKPERRTPRSEQLSPEFPSASRAVTGAHQRAAGEPLTPVTPESSAASQSPSALPAASAKPPKLAGIHKKQPVVIPHVAALGALVGALARASELDKALQLYKQVARDPIGAQALTMSDRYMWQSLMELCCRKGRTAIALQVFDDWKVHISHALKRGAEADQLPRLSNVTLAFLEACCRADAAFEWRVFDVCAAMRQQSERKQQALLARPRKLSHHFFEEA